MQPLRGFLRPSSYVILRALDGLKTSAVCLRTKFRDSDKVIFVDNRHHHQVMTLADLRERQQQQNSKFEKEDGGKHLREIIHVHKGALGGHQIPTMKLLNAIELEESIRLARHKRTNEIFEKIDGGVRVKEKQLHIKPKTQASEVQYLVPKVRKWLEKDHFVRVTCKGVEESIVSDFVAACIEGLDDHKKELLIISK